MNEVTKQKISDLLKTLAIILISFVAAMLIGAIFVVILGKSPLETYKQLILSPFTNMGNFGTIIRNMIPLSLVAIGVAFAGKCGLSNLGGDGQFLMGALAMILVSTTIGKHLGWMSIIVGMLLGTVFGAVCGGFAGWLKAKFKVSEIITVLMLNYIVEYFIAYLDHGPMLKVGSSTPQTESIAEYERIPRIFDGTMFSYSILIVLVCILIYWIVMQKTTFGYKIRVLGGSVKAAQYGGVDPEKYYTKVMAISGAFAGFAGVVEVCSFAYCVQDGICNSYGFNGVLIALLGFYHPVGILLAAFFFSVLNVGGNVMQITCAVPTTFVSMLKGLMVLFILLGLSAKLKKKFRPSKKQACEDLKESVKSTVETTVKMKEREAV